MRRALLLSFAHDFHAAAVQALLRRMGGDADIVDTAEFPSKVQLSYSAGEHSAVCLNGRDVRDYGVVWSRRAAMPQPQGIENREELRFAMRESREALWGALHAAGVPIVNDPAAEDVACYKPYQLETAARCGLRVPATLVTNAPAEVEAFHARHDHVVYKGLSATTLQLTDTRPLRRDDLDELWRLQHAPVIFQEYVPLGREYRVTLVEDDAFAAEIAITNPDAAYDWRIDPNYQVRGPVDLPTPVLDGLRRLRRRLGLHSGSVDLRETPDGEIYFLEINPSGQFLFLDVLAGMRVGERFCEMLLSATPVTGAPTAPPLLAEDSAQIWAESSART